MNAHTMSCLGLGLLGMLAVACGGDDPSASSSGSLSAGVTDTDAGAGDFVFVQGMNAAYSIAPVNGTGRTTQVTSVDFRAAGVDPSTFESALATPYAIAAVGTLKGDVFVATAVYQTLQGVAPSVGDSFYVTRVRADGDVATELNVNQDRMFGRLDLTPVSVPFLDKGWLSARVLAGNAVVAGSFDGPQEGAAFDVSAVYLKLPDTTKCPELVITCAEGTVTTYRRDTNRCVTAAGCTTLGKCPEFIPVCDPGYSLASWTADNGCRAFVCDPAFDPAPTL